MSDIFGAIGGGLQVAQGIKSLFGGSSGDSPRIAADKNYDRQKEFATRSIRWKVADAKAAGIHPLYALGAQTSSFTPSYVGDSGSGPDYGSAADSFLAAGQNLSRAKQAGNSTEERTMSRLQIENQSLQNDLLRSQIARENSAQLGPGLPAGSIIPGQGDTRVVMNPLTRTISEPSTPAKEAGLLPDYTFAQTPNGGFAPVPSGDVKQRTEDSWADVMWAYRNLLLPNFSMSGHAAPPGTSWSHRHQEYRYPPGTRFYQGGKEVR